MRLESFQVGVHYIQLSEAGIAVNDINSERTQCVVGAIEVLPGKCIEHLEKGKNWISCQSQTRVHVYLFYCIWLFYTALTEWKYSISQLPHPRSFYANYKASKTVIHSF